jgi:hypothetical protein
MHGFEEHGGSSRTIRLQSWYRSVDQMLLHGKEISHILSSRKQTFCDGNCPAENERPRWGKADEEIQVQRNMAGGNDGG